MPRKKKAEDSTENEETQEVSKLDGKELEKAAEANQQMEAKKQKH